MKRSTVERFSKESGIPKDQIDFEILNILAGYDKDVVAAYMEIKKFRVLRDLAKKKGKSFQDIVDLLSS